MSAGGSRRPHAAHAAAAAAGPDVDVDGHRCRIVTELLDSGDVELARATGADDFVVSDALSSYMLAQLSENPELDAVFTDLFDAEGSALGLKPVDRYVAYGRARCRSHVSSPRPRARRDRDRLSAHRARGSRRHGRREPEEVEHRQLRRRRPDRRDRSSGVTLHATRASGMTAPPSGGRRARPRARGSAPARWAAIGAGADRARRFRSFGDGSAICFPVAALYGERYISIGPAPSSVRT